jgi:hypothetical protein
MSSRSTLRRQTLFTACRDLVARWLDLPADAGGPSPRMVAVTDDTADAAPLWQGEKPAAESTEPAAEVLAAECRHPAELQHPAEAQPPAEAQAPADAPLPAEPAAEAAGAAPLQSGQHLLETILGADLTAEPAVRDQCQQLATAMLAGQAAATYLVGQLLIASTVSADGLPRVVKDLGEAYYAWHREQQDPGQELLTALKQWAEQRCRAVGILNRIELCTPGERFDSSRHAASEAGPSIAEVRGWIVTRGNEKVYSKASVVAT